MLLLLHSAFMFCAVKLLLKGEAGVCALNSHGNYIVDHGKSWKIMELCFEGPLTVVKGTQCITAYYFAKN